MPGGGGPAIWNRRGCSLEILNLTPKGEHLAMAYKQILTLKETA